MGRDDGHELAGFANMTDNNGFQSEVDNRKPGHMVQSIVESGITEVPPEFVKPRAERVSTTDKSQVLLYQPAAADIIQTASIPVIDMAMLGEGEAGTKQLLAETARACEEWGCFYLINHGVPDPVMDAAMDTVERFFALPIAEKEEFRMKTVGGMGYGRAFDRPGVAKDWVDSVILNDSMKEDSPESLRASAYYDLVLTKPPGAQEVLESYGKAMQELTFKTSTMLSEALGQAPEFLSNKSNAKNSAAFNHYPPCPQPDLVMGFSAHEDSGMFTFLQQGKVAGLEVLSKDEHWVPLLPVAHAFIVIIADFLQVISNDRFKSVSHRVVAGPLGRYVIANFMVPDNHSMMQPAPELCSKFNLPVYKSMPYEDYLKIVLFNDPHIKRLETVKLVPALQH